MGVERNSDRTVWVIVGLIAVVAIVALVYLFSQSDRADLSRADGGPAAIEEQVEAAGEKVEAAAERAGEAVEDVGEKARGDQAADRPQEKR